MTDLDFSHSTKSRSSSRSQAETTSSRSSPASRTKSSTICTEPRGESASSPRSFTWSAGSCKAWGTFSSSFSSFISWLWGEQFRLTPLRFTQPSRQASHRITGRHHWNHRFCWACNGQLHQYPVHPRGSVRGFPHRPCGVRLVSVSYRKETPRRYGFHSAERIRECSLSGAIFTSRRATTGSG
jgi:hypothetical protein